MDIERRVRDLGGAVRPADLGTSRTVRRAVGRLVAEGALVRHPGGCVALPGADQDVIRARQFGARLTCISAAAAHGFALLDQSATTHLAIPHRRGPSLSTQLIPTRAVVHREVPALLTAAPTPGSRAGWGHSWSHRRRRSHGCSGAWSRCRPS